MICPKCGDEVEIVFSQSAFGHLVHPGEAGPPYYTCERDMEPRVCQHCDEPIVMGFVDYGGTQGWVHVATEEALCDPENEDSPDAFPYVD